MELNPLDLPASNLTPEAQNGSGRFHGTKPAEHYLPEEKPWHRAAALMFAAGAVTIKEVAEAFDVTPPTVRNLLRTPWFQERVSDLMAEHGGRDIMTLFKAETYNSLVTLVELRDNTKVPAAVRRATAVDILDRALGKAVQRVETTDVPVSADPVAEAQRLERENGFLRSPSEGQSPPQ